MPEIKKRYTHETKGGEYELVGVSSGAGGRKGDVVMVYQSTVNGQLFHREPEDFSKRMKQAPDITGQLLAALEAFRAEDSRNCPQDVIDQMDAAIAAAKGEV